MTPAVKPCLFLLGANICALLCTSTHARSLAQSSSPTSDGDSYDIYIASQPAGELSGTFPVVPAVLGNFSSSGEFVKQKVWESFPAFYRLATSQEAKSNETALYEALPGWEIAYLADGSVGGAEYGTFTKDAQPAKSNLADKLGIRDQSILEVQVSGLDAVVNYTSPAEICLQPALVAARQGSLTDLAAASESQTQSIQQLVALWNVDVMGEGMQGVMTLFTKGGYTISLKTIVGQDTLCQAINQPDQSKCACTSDYYLVDIEAASHTTYAAIVLPANKPIGAGAIQRALLQSLESRAVALVVPPSVDLGPIYRWVLVLQSDDDTTTRFGVI